MVSDRQAVAADGSEFGSLARVLPLAIKQWWLMHMVWSLPMSLVGMVLYDLSPTNTLLQIGLMTMCLVVVLLSVVK